MNSSKEQFLLFRIRVFQDQAAFRTLLDAHGSGLLRFFHVKLPSTQDADDAYSVTCMRVWEYAKRSEVDHFSGLLYTIGRGVVSEFYRSRGQSEASVDDFHHLEDARQPDQKMLDNVDAGLVKDALKQLSSDEQQAIILRYLEGYRVRDVASSLGKKESATGVMIHRALKKLNRLLESKKE